MVSANELRELNPFHRLSAAAPKEWAPYDPFWPGARSAVKARERTADRVRLEPRQLQDAREHAVGVEMLTRELPRRRRVPRIVSLDGFEALRRRLDVDIREQAEPHGDVPAKAGILHHHRAPRRQVAATAIAEPTTPLFPSEHIGLTGENSPRDC